MRQLRDKAELRVLQLKDFSDSIPQSRMVELTTDYNAITFKMNTLLDAMISDVKNNTIVLNRGLVKLSENYEEIRKENADQYAIFDLKALETLKRQPAGGSSFILLILSEIGEWLLDKKIQSNIDQVKELKWRKWDEIK